MAGEWLAFGGALDFYTAPASVNNDVEIGLGRGVFAVVEIEEQVAIVEADYGAATAQRKGKVCKDPCSTSRLNA